MPATLLAPLTIPSIWRPAGAEAAVLTELAWVLTVGAAVITGLMAVLIVLAIRRPRGRRMRLRWWVWGGGIAFPVVVLTALLLYSTQRTDTLVARAAQPDLVVSVVGRLWWWEMRYRDPASGLDVVWANELRVPVGRRVHRGLVSEDVVHSFWVPELGGKMDLVPGRVNRLVVTPTRAGVYRGQCAEFCGEQHARMALHVVAMPPAEFDAWLAGRVRTLAAPPSGAAVTAGRRAFEAQGCAVCHGAADGHPGPALGPPLSGVAQRQALGAGVLPNGPGAVKRWLVGVQGLKPGARMPSYAHLDAETLDALAQYVEQLP